jgi:hypothetical protein
MRRIFLFVLASLLIAIAFFSILPPVEARVFSPSGCGTPTIDGVINAAEWANADTEAWTTTSTSGILYMMNDGSNLYIGVIINDDDFASNDGFAVSFDNDNGGEIVREVGDDYVQAVGASQFYDSHWGGASLVSDDSPGGTIDGQGAGSHQGSSNHFELSHPLDSGDTGHDFSLSAGQTIGFLLSILLDASWQDIDWGEFYNPSTWLHDYQVAGCARAVGGIYASNDKLSILTPYIALVGLIGVISTIFAIRRWRKD